MRCLNVPSSPMARSPLRSSPDGNLLCKKGVFEDLKVFLHGAAWNLRVGGYGLVVDLFSVRKRGDFEKAAERGKVARRSFLQ